MTGESSMINTGVTRKNPFPGSRPFVSAEDKFFFGRAGAVSELVDTLLQTFIPVHTDIETAWTQEATSRYGALQSGDLESESIEDLMKRLNQ